MKRTNSVTLQLSVGLFTSSAILGCAVESSELDDPETSLADGGGRTIQASFDQGPAADVKLASLAKNTIQCLGKLSSDDYQVIDGMVRPAFFKIDMSNGEVSFPGSTDSVRFPRWRERRFRGSPEQAALLACPNAENSDEALNLLQDLTNTLASQKLDPSLAQAMGEKWEARRLETSCPTWQFVRVISGDPEVEGNLQFGAFQTTSLYTCEGEDCAEKAASCASGYGDAFLLDASGSEIITDPMYWEDTRNFGYSITGISNSPYSRAELASGYLHNMRAYNDSFAAIQRIGEKCRDPILEGVLRANNCSDDPAFPWFCNSICL